MEEDCSVVYMELAGMDGREHLMNGAWDGATLLCFELRIRFGTFFVGNYDILDGYR